MFKNPSRHITDWSPGGVENIETASLLQIARTGAVVHVTIETVTALTVLQDRYNRDRERLRGRKGEREGEREGGVERAYL